MIDKIIAYESGTLSEEDTVKLFQELIDTGQAWKLQGSYGRTARDLIDAGLCTLGPKPVTDYYGNRVPSKYEVAPNTPGHETYTPEEVNNG